MNATLSTRQVRLVGLLVGLVVLAAGYMVVTKLDDAEHADDGELDARRDHSGEHDSRAEQDAHAHGDAGEARQPAGCPVKIALALRKHPVVVVSLVTCPAPTSTSTPPGRRKAGADEVGAGFVAARRSPPEARHRRCSASSECVTTPAVLVVKRPAASTRSSRASSTAPWSRRPSPTLADETGRPPSGSRGRAARAVRSQRQPARAPCGHDAGPRSRRCRASSTSTSTAATTAREPRSYNFADAQQASTFVTEAVEALVYLGLRDPRLKRRKGRVTVEWHTGTRAITRGTSSEPVADVIALPQLERLPPNPDVTDSGASSFTPTTVRQGSRHSSSSGRPSRSPTASSGCARDREGPADAHRGGGQASSPRPRGARERDRPLQARPRSRTPRARTRSSKELAERRQQASDAAREARGTSRGRQGGSLRDDRGRDRTRRDVAGGRPGPRPTRSSPPLAPKPTRSLKPPRTEAEAARRACGPTRTTPCPRPVRRPRRSWAPHARGEARGRVTPRPRRGGHRALGGGGRAFSGERGGRADRRGPEPPPTSC